MGGKTSVAGGLFAGGGGDAVDDEDGEGDAVVELGRLTNGPVTGSGDHDDIVAVFENQRPASRCRASALGAELKRAVA